MEPYKCDPCQVRSKVSRGVEYCKTCQETYCKECAEVHKSSKSTKDHHQVNIKDLRLPSAAELSLQRLRGCIFHPEKHLEFFCMKHNVLICSHCLLQHRMADHCNVIEVADAGEAIIKSDIVDGVRTDLQTVTRRLEEDIQRIKLQQTHSRQVHMEIRGRLRETRAALLNLFDELENNIMYGITCDQERQNGQLENLLTIINQTLFRINDAAKFLESIIDSGITSDVFKCILVIGQFLEHCVTEYENTKRVPIWICHNLLTISAELQTLLNKTRGMIERHRTYTMFSRTGFSPLRTNYPDIFNIIGNYKRESVCQAEKLNQGLLETSRCSKLITEKLPKHEEHTYDKTMDLRKDSYDEMEIRPHLLQTAHHLDINQQTDKCQRRSEETARSKSVQTVVIEEISNDFTNKPLLISEAESAKLKQSNISESSKKSRKPTSFGRNANGNHINDIGNSDETNLNINGKEEVEFLQENKGTNRINLNEVDTCNSYLSKETDDNEIQQIDRENPCILDEKENIMFVQTPGNKHSFECIRVKNKTATMDSPRDDIQKEENKNIFINEFNDVFDTSLKSPFSKSSGDIKVIPEEHEVSQHSITEKESECDTKVKMELEWPLTMNPEVFEVPGKSKSRSLEDEFNIKCESEIEIPLRGKKPFDISVMAPSDDEIIVCDYQKYKLVKFDAEQHQVKDTYHLPAKIVNANLLRGQMVAICHKRRAQITILAYNPSFKLIRVLDTQYKADFVQSVDDENMLVSMYDSSGRRSHVHIISNIGRLKEKLKLNRPILYSFSLAVLSSDEFKFGYRILQSCSATNALYCFEKNGQDIFKYKVKSPDCVAVHDSGYIFVTERIGRIHILSSSGEKVYETKCCSNVTSIAVTPSMDRILLTRFKEKRISILSLDFNIKSVP